MRAPTYGARISVLVRHSCGPSPQQDTRAGVAREIADTSLTGEGSNLRSGPCSRAFNQRSSLGRFVVPILLCPQCGPAQSKEEAAKVPPPLGHIFGVLIFRHKGLERSCFVAMWPKRTVDVAGRRTGVPGNQSHCRRPVMLTQHPLPRRPSKYWNTRTPAAQFSDDFLYRRMIMYDHPIASLRSRRASCALD